VSRSEDAASVGVLCVDKTGTFTQNQLSSSLLCSPCLSCANAVTLGTRGPAVPLDGLVAIGMVSVGIPGLSAIPLPYTLAGTGLRRRVLAAG